MFAILCLNKSFSIVQSILPDLFSGRLQQLWVRSGCLGLRGHHVHPPHRTTSVLEPETDDAHPANHEGGVHYGRTRLGRSHQRDERPGKSQHGQTSAMEY